MRTITLSSALVLVVLSTVPAQARQPVASRSVVPRGPGLFSRMIGRGHPAYVRDALRSAGKLQGAARDKLLFSTMRKGIRGGTLSIHAASKLSKQASNTTRDRMLKVYARFHQPGLSVKQVKKVVDGTNGHNTHNAILERYARFHIKRGLSLGDTIKLSKKTTYVGPANRILGAYKTQHQGKLTKRELKRLSRARAVPSSGSSSSDDGYSVMNVGGMNVGGVSMGGRGYGGVEVGNIRVGGVSYGGTNVGGVSVGGFDL